jgi:hypothetical protein
MTNLTPAQLEEFESTFRYFDKDETNTLHLAEMIAALASLGIVYSEEDMDLIYNQLLDGYGAVTFEAFINLLVCRFHSFLSMETSSDWARYLSFSRLRLWKTKHHLSSSAKHSGALQKIRSVPFVIISLLLFFSPFFIVSY